MTSTLSIESKEGARICVHNVPHGTFWVLMHRKRVPKRDIQIIKGTTSATIWLGTLEIVLFKEGNSQENLSTQP